MGIPAVISNEPRGLRKGVKPIDLTEEILSRGREFPCGNTMVPFDSYNPPWGEGMVGSECCFPGERPKEGIAMKIVLQVPS